MKLDDLLNEIKLGDDDYTELKLAEDIEEDIDVLEEGIRYVRINRRLNKIHDRLSTKTSSNKNLSTVIRGIGKTSNIFESVDKMMWTGRQPTKAQARAKMVSLKKSYDKLVVDLKGRDIKNVVSESGLGVLLGEAIGSILFGAKKLQKIAETTVATSLQKRMVPYYLKYGSNLEQKLLKKAEANGYEPDIREETEE